MKKTFVNKIIKSLEEERKQIIEKLMISSDIDCHGDEVDQIQARILANVANQISNREEAKIRQIDTTLLKIKEGTFGFCEECGEEIAEKRLTFNPSFINCVSCAEISEYESKKYLK